MSNSKRYDDKFLKEMGTLLMKSKVQCGLCSDAYTLLEVTPDWDSGMWICEDCEREEHVLMEQV